MNKNAAAESITEQQPEYEAEEAEKMHLLGEEQPQGSSPQMVLEGVDIVGAKLSGEKC